MTEERAAPEVVRLEAHLAVESARQAVDPLEVPVAALQEAAVEASLAEVAEAPRAGAAAAQQVEVVVAPRVAVAEVQVAVWRAVTAAAQQVEAVVVPRVAVTEVWWLRPSTRDFQRTTARCQAMRDRALRVSTPTEG